MDVQDDLYLWVFIEAQFVTQNIGSSLSNERPDKNI